jgi:hypothetical protein
MDIGLKNYDFSYLNAKDKPVFVPSKEGREAGYKIRSLVTERVEFDDIYYHLRSGGHVAALHAHKQNNLFSRIDLKNYFYSISRNRINRELRSIGIRHHERFSKWSTVKNPYTDPSYALPYGFVQSPLLATLAFQNSAIGRFLREVPPEVVVSVYLDDIGLSSCDENLLQRTHHATLVALEESKFIINTDKTAAPSDQMVLFNCDLTFENARVRAERVEEFFSVERSEASAAAFLAYCEAVAVGNAVD